MLAVCGVLLQTNLLNSRNTFSCDCFSSRVSVALCEQPLTLHTATVIAQIYNITRKAKFPVRL